MRLFLPVCLCTAVVACLATAAEPQGKLTPNSTSTPTDSSIVFRKVASLPTKDTDDFRYAAIGVSFEHQSVVSRNYLVSKGEDVRGRIGAYLWSLDPRDPKRTKLPDSTTFGFVPNSTLAYQVHWGRGVQFRDTRTHKVSGDYIPHELREDTNMGPAVDPSGKLMVTRSQLNHLQFWDIETRKPITGELKQAGNVYRMEFSSDGKWFFSRAARKLSIWNPNRGELVAGPLSHDVAGFPYSPKTGRLATFENNREDEDEWRTDLVVRAGKAFAEVRRISMQGRVRLANWVDDEHLLIIGDYKEPKSSRQYPHGRRLVNLVTLSSDKPSVKTLARHTWIKGVAIAPNGKHFIVRTRSESSCWKVGQPKPVWTKSGDYLVSFGDKDWVLLHDGPLVAYSLADGKELWRRKDVEKFRSHGPNIWTCNEEQMEVWRVGHAE